MAFRTLTTLIHSETDQTGTLDASIDLARRLDAHLTVVLAGVNAVDPGVYYAGMNAVVLTTALNDADAAVKDMADALKRRMAAEDITWDDVSFVTPSANVGHALVQRARFGDLTVLPQPYGKDAVSVDVGALEAVLLDSAAPVLVLPTGAKTAAPPKNILLPWDQGAPAMAAARAAIPFMAEADEVLICVIDPPSHGPERSDPGGALAAFLSRHGAKVRISVIPSSGQRISDVIQSEAKSQGSDMIVMGGYGHSRTRQYILGGTTRRMLEHSPLPILMAH
ncbi:universal stress protein [Oceaniglobus ichthyenteri]|uniref:universal stress protein n=1 Tax=Oceaniglobus ichthyenteri TaxID=2136177 RepID=UPI0013DD8B3C|nr:universal stress protein [Oceaniglobus ichthyenteri]